MLSFVLAVGCHHDDGASTTTTSSNQTAAGGGLIQPDPQVDPTIPSWAPPSCRAYHAATVRAADCQALDQPTREDIQTKYQGAHDSWQQMKDVPPETIQQISIACEGSAKTVKDQVDAVCPHNGTTKPPPG
jgi:hypothetical protein